MIPKKLYHATYRQFLDSIKTNGLGNTNNKMWTDSKQGVVYLADDPWVAESYAEESEWVYEQEEPDVYLDNIVIIEVDSTKLDKKKLRVDKNVLLDNEENNATWEYYGVIPLEACKILKEENNLEEWVDAKGNKLGNQSAEVVYIWDMYIDPRDKGTWCSAEEYNGEYDGSVFKTKEAAFREGKIHLMELEDEGELRGLPEDYDIDVVAIPKSRVSDYTLEFSGIK